MKRFLLISLISALLATSPIQAEDSSQNQKAIVRCIASWYSEKDPGILKTTANMELFDDKGLTCAMWDVPFGTMLEITNLNNGKSVVVRVNDRGPAKRLVDEGRLIDLTKKAFSDIAPLKEGLIPVRVTILN